MKRQWLCFLILISSLLLPAGLTAGAIPLMTDSGAVLVQIPIESTQDLMLVRQLELPVYARLTGVDGEYLLAGLTGRQVRGFQLPVLVLDDELVDDYYLATMMFGRERIDWSAYGHLLLDDGRQALLSTTAEQMERLAAAGAQVARLELEPIALSGRSPYSLPDTAVYDPEIEAMIDQVTKSGLTAYEQMLTGLQQALIGGSYYTIATRHTSSGEPIQKATQWAYEHFEAVGLPVSYDQWSSGSHNGRNVVATLTGQRQPDQIFIICAHLDDMPSGAVAPGADDNGSGSAGVLLAADILSQYDWSYTIKFILWTGEEQGLLGSDVWAEWASAQGLDILGVLNLDMIGYNSDGAPIIDLHARSWLPDSVVLSNLFASVVDVYSIELTPHILIDNWLGNYSDNKSFWDEGYAAILAIEDDDDFTPYYHTVGDTLASLDMIFFAQSVKAAVGTVAHLAEPYYIDGGLVGAVTDSSSGEGVRNSQVVAVAQDNLRYQTFTDTSGYYTFTLPTDTYTVSAEAVGYHSLAVGGVQVVAQQVVTQDLILDPSPIIQVDPKRYMVELDYGNAISEMLTISNTGHTTLTFTITETPTVGWLLVDTLSGTVPISESVSLQVGLDASGLWSGVYHTTLNVLSDDSATPQVGIPVTLTVDCQVSPTAHFSHVVTGYDVSFLNETSDALAYHWDFGDGVTSTLESPTHTYSQTGTYSVTLTAYSDCATDVFQELVSPAFRVYLPLCMR